MATPLTRFPHQRARTARNGRIRRADPSPTVATLALSLAIAFCGGFLIAAYLLP